MICHRHNLQQQLGSQAPESILDHTANDDVMGKGVEEEEEAEGGEPGERVGSVSNVVMEGSFVQQIVPVAKRLFSAEIHGDGTRQSLEERQCRDDGVIHSCNSNWHDRELLELIFCEK